MGQDDAFGTSGKTVIRPNPGGAFNRDVQRQPSQPFPSQNPPADRTVISSAPAPAPFRRDPMRPSGDMGASRAPSDDWLTGGRQAPPSSLGLERPSLDQNRRSVEKIPLEVALGAKDGIEVPSANPITAAASPLLILLGRLRLMIVDMQARPLMSHVGREIEEFERKCLESGISREDARVGKYALCATADDIVQNLQGTDGHVWMQYSMLAQFFQTRTSGVGFFHELDKLRANPAVNYDLLELMHACLCLGFEGQFRGAHGGDAELQRIRRDVYQTLRRLRSRSDDDISPRWMGLQLSMKGLKNLIPNWVVAGLAGVTLVGVYFLLRFLVAADSEAVAATLVDLHPNSAIAIERAVFEPYVEKLVDENTGQLARIRATLKPEIDAGTVGVEPVGDQIVMRLNNLILFESGKAETKPEFGAVAARIAEMLEKEPGPIYVTGHTDNVKLKSSSRFASNHDLSVKRAESVEKELEPGISDKARFVVGGKGEDEPIAQNDSAEGRAQNRRVELMIPKEETLQQGGASAAVVPPAPPEDGADAVVE
ncbi:MAG: DotU family type IV/VI secretion system protein [Rhizobiaceae bacterium]|nr:DotU family type IV/VI secretion system protein [Rhizobiaceae bacterium]